MTFPLSINPRNIQPYALSVSPKMGCVTGAVPFLSYWDSHNETTGLSGHVTAATISCVTFVLTSDIESKQVILYKVMQIYHIENYFYIPPLPKKIHE